MTLSNGILSDFNDSTSGVAPSVNDIMNYAKTLEICPVKELRLGSSGYRFYRKNTTEFIFDVGNIGPDYQPAHAHSDTFNFEWYISSKPIIVDTGTSTYENNEIRRFERSTRAHNTIEVDGGEQSEIWHSFRVGRRAKTKIIMESENHLIAVHNGYDHIGAVHQREYLFQDDKIEIKDSIKSAKNHKCRFYIHFAPGIDYTLKENQVAGSDFFIEFENNFSFIEEGLYNKAIGFNVRKQAKYLCVTFENSLTTKLSVAK